MSLQIGDLIPSLLEVGFWCIYVGLPQKKSYNKPNTSFKDNGIDSTDVEQDPTHINITFDKCEQPAIKALHYLQIKVSDVIEPTNSEETSIFWFLLTHLLSPSMIILDGNVFIPSKEVVEQEELPKKHSWMNMPEEVW